MVTRGWISKLLRFRFKKILIYVPVLVPVPKSTKNKVLVRVPVLKNVHLSFGSKAYTSNDVGNKEREIEVEITSKYQRLSLSLTITSFSKHCPLHKCRVHECKVYGFTIYDIFII